MLAQVSFWSHNVKPLKKHCGLPGYIFGHIVDCPGAFPVNSLDCTGTFLVTLWHFWSTVWIAQVHFWSHCGLPMVYISGYIVDCLGAFLVTVWIACGIFLVILWIPRCISGDNVSWQGLLLLTVWTAQLHFWSQSGLPRYITWHSKDCSGIFHKPFSLNIYFCLKLNGPAALPKVCYLSLCINSYFTVCDFLPILSRNG